MLIYRVDVYVIYTTRVVEQDVSRYFCSIHAPQS